MCCKVGWSDWTVQIAARDVLRVIAEDFELEGVRRHVVSHPCRVIVKVVLLVERRNVRRKPDVVPADRERVRRFHYTAARNAHVKAAMTKRLDNEVVFKCRPQNGLVEISKYLTL